MYNFTWHIYKSFNQYRNYNGENYFVRTKLKCVKVQTKNTERDNVNKIFIRDKIRLFHLASTTFVVCVIFFLFLVYKRYKTQINKCLYTVQYLLSSQPSKYI